MYQELLSRVAEQERQFSSELQKPATEEQLQLLAELARKQLHA